MATAKTPPARWAWPKRPWANSLHQKRLMDAAQVGRALRASQFGREFGWDGSLGELALPALHVSQAADSSVGIVAKPGPDCVVVPDGVEQQGVAVPGKPDMHGLARAAFIDATPQRPHAQTRGSMGLPKDCW